MTKRAVITKATLRKHLIWAGYEYISRGICSPFSLWREAWQRTGRHGAGEGGDFEFYNSARSRKKV